MNESAKPVERRIAPRKVAAEIRLVLRMLGIAPGSSDTPLFFACGGSLQATRLATQIEQRLGIAVGLRDLFETRSPEELALRLAGVRRAPSFVAALADRHMRHRSSLSFSQERMAFMQALAGGSAAYHVPFGLRIRGELDSNALLTAVASLPERHPVLRTSFVAAAEGMVALPSGRAKLPVRLLDEPRANTLRLQEIASEFCNAPFDLERGATGRALLIRTHETDHLLVLVFHHIAMDQWAYEMLIAELTEHYARLTGTDAATGAPAATDDYPAYAAWHRHWFREHAFERERAFWQRHLDGATRVTFEPDFTRPPTPSYRGERVGLSLAEEQWVDLETLAKARQVSLPMLLFAVLGVLLRNHSGADDLTLGLAIANRHHVGSGRSLGTLVNSLALRLRLDPTARFADLLSQVRATFLDAIDHQDIPFEVLVKQLNRTRDPSASPLFGVMLNVLNTPPAELRLGDAVVERVEIDRKAAQFDVTVTVDRLHTRTIWFEYAIDLYARRTIERIAERFDEILRALPHRLQSPLSALPHRTRAEAVETQAWGQGDAFRSVGFSLRGPDGDRVVAICGDESLTFAELGADSHRFASGLRERPGRAVQRIGLLLGRSVRLPVALVGALRAGVAFVPLDPNFPPERLAFLVADSKLDLIVTDAAGTRPAWLPAHVELKPIAAVIAAGSASAKLPPVDDARAAYVLYTSGSSGQPKGVEVPRRALFNFLAAMRRRPGLAPDDRLLAVTTLSFDIALLELLLPLTVGAAVIIAQREQALDGLALAELIERHDVTVLQATPSTWLQLLEAGWEGREGLRALVGGEALPPELARRLMPRVRALWNMYGPTETTVWSTCFPVESADVERIPIGRPIANTVVAVLDADSRPVGVGVAGEIVIGGDGVATGYVDRAEMTAQKFQHLDAMNDSLVFYRTGDLGRWNRKGQLECLGRLDDQLKIRGFRIEASEIESAALEVEDVTRAVALATGAGTTQARLLLFVQTLRTDGDVSERVRQRLRARLPDYMQPQMVRALQTLPRLPNGKIDRAALARLASVPSSSRSSAPPQTAMEEALHPLWCELLELTAIGRDNDFFDLGGHSLLAMRLVTRVRDDLGKQCSLAQVFQNPTLASLAATLESARTAAARPLVPLRGEDHGTPVFCLCGVRVYRALASQLPPGFPVLAIYVPADFGRLDTVRLASEYVEIIRSQQPHGPYRLLGFSFGGVLAFEAAQQLVAAGETVELLAILDSDVPGPQRRPALRTAVDAIRTLGGRIGRRETVPDYILAMRDYQPTRFPGRLLFVEASRATQFDPGYGWDALADAVTIEKIDADHLELLEAPAVAKVADAIRRALAERPGDASAGG